MDCKTVIKELSKISDSKRLESNKRFGITAKNSLGVSVPGIRKLSRKIGKNHALAQELWRTGVHEARILATMVDDPKYVSEIQMEKWVRDIDSWDICDHACGNLFDKTKFAYNKAIEWSRQEGEFVKRAAFSLMAYLAVHDKKAGDKKFLRFLPVIKREAYDERNFVKKAINWALRQIGKRNIKLNIAAIKTAKEIRVLNSRSARWIAHDALRELQSKAVQRRLE